MKEEVPVKAQRLIPGAMGYDMRYILVVIPFDGNHYLVGRHSGTGQLAVENMASAPPADIYVSGECEVSLSFLVAAMTYLQAWNKLYDGFDRMLENNHLEK